VQAGEQADRACAPTCATWHWRSLLCEKPHPHGMGLAGEGRGLPTSTGIVDQSSPALTDGAGRSSAPSELSRGGPEGDRPKRPLYAKDCAPLVRAMLANGFENLIERQIFLPVLAVASIVIRSGTVQSQEPGKSVWTQFTLKDVKGVSFELLVG